MNKAIGSTSQHALVLLFSKLIFFDHVSILYSVFFDMVKGQEVWMCHLQNGDVGVVVHNRAFTGQDIVVKVCICVSQWLSICLFP